MAGQSKFDTSVKLLKGAKFGDIATDRPDTFQSQEQLDNELINCSKVSPDELANEAFFGKGRNFFIWVKQSADEPGKGRQGHDEMMHFYHLKRLCRKKD